MKKFNILISMAVLITLLNPIGFSQPSRYEGKLVRKIDFQGLKNLNSEDFIEIMKTTIGYPLKSTEVRQDIKNIFNKGKLESVIVEIEDYKDGVRLRFKCKERPNVNSITFKGLDEFVDSDLSDIVLLKEGEPYREDLIHKSIEILKKKYETEGLFNAIITYKIKKLKGKNNVDVLFVVDEGEEIRVKKISVLGVKNLDSQDIIDVMETEEEGIVADGAFKRDEYEKDKTKIISYCREQGYLDAQIIEDRVEYEWDDPVKKEKRVIFIIIKISEGEKYYFDKYSVNFVNKKKKNVFKGKIFYKDFLLSEHGELFNYTKFQMDKQSISLKYASRGYIFARVIPRRSVSEKEVLVDKVKVKRKFVKIDFNIVEGGKAYIESIIIKGNKKTKDKVIRRELTVKAGELFNSRRMQISRERVYNLGFFKQVNFDIRPGSREGYMNLIVDVEEQPSGTISLGGGYGTTTGFSIFADIAENNLLGNGQRVGVKFEYGPLRSSITLSFRERWFLDYPVGFNASIFYYLYRIQSSSVFTNTNEIAEYQKQSFGYSLGFSYRFLYFFEVGTHWTQAFKSYVDPSGNSSDEVFKIVSQGLQLKNTHSIYIYRNSKDNYLNPTRGFNLGMTIAFTGGWWLGDDHFIEYKPQFEVYFSPFNIPFLKTHPVVLEFRLSGDFIGKPWVGNSVIGQDYNDNQWLESEDRIYVGGVERGLRGWDYWDGDFPDSWRYGLFHRVMYGLEVRVPIHPQMLWFAFFIDAASLWSDKFWEKQVGDSFNEVLQQDINDGKLHRIQDFFSSKVNLLSYFRYSYGFGFRIQIPMMPLRFWFGKKVIYEKKKFREISGLRFQFSIGDFRF
ncbi:outer membrane protein assembly factor BamA [Spirochaetota bacterium]